VLEDSLDGRAWFLSAHRLPHAFLAHESEQVIRIIQQFEPDVCFLDYDLGLGVSSESVATYLAKSGFDGRIILHTQTISEETSCKDSCPALRLK
jgi:NAD+-processing family protein with receiver domain